MKIMIPRLLMNANSRLIQDNYTRDQRYHSKYVNCYETLETKFNNYWQFNSSVICCLLAPVKQCSTFNCNTKFFKKTILTKSFANPCYIHKGCWHPSYSCQSRIDRNYATSSSPYNYTGRMWRHIRRLYFRRGRTHIAGTLWHHHNGCQMRLG